MDKLLQWRKANKLTQTEAAKRFGVHQSLYSQWENGKVKVPVERVPQFSEITGLPRIEIRPDKPDLFAS